MKMLIIWLVTACSCQIRPTRTPIPPLVVPPIITREPTTTTTTTTSLAPVTTSAAFATSTAVIVTGPSQKEDKVSSSNDSSAGGYIIGGSVLMVILLSVVFAVLLIRKRFYHHDDHIAKDTSERSGFKSVFSRPKENEIEHSPFRSIGILTKAPEIEVSKESRKQNVVSSMGTQSIIAPIIPMVLPYSDHCPPCIIPSIDGYYYYDKYGNLMPPYYYDANMDIIYVDEKGYPCNKVVNPHLPKVAGISNLIAQSSISPENYKYDHSLRQDEMHKHESIQTMEKLDQVTESKEMSSELLMKVPIVDKNEPLRIQTTQSQFSTKTKQSKDFFNLECTENETYFKPINPDESTQTQFQTFMNDFETSVAQKFSASVETEPGLIFQQPNV